ncbi:anthranilate synthase component I family protein [Pseudocnuella soli]|uniref:anthranilate synthase component I family protein n=1 Tax=Pseudocnuella soli TaxID=2502779 RepID=UPI00104D0B28|nr:anthranilate synthase component I family protein [Pseudocnuella soli]
MKHDTAPLATAVFTFSDLQLLQQKMLNWASRFNIFLFLDGQQYNFAPRHYECLLAVGQRASVTESLQDLDDFTSGGRWCFGHLSYDLKNSLHAIHTIKSDPVGFSPFYFFEPETVITINGNEAVITATNPNAVWQKILAESITEKGPQQPVQLQPRLTKEEYLDAIRKLQQHIVRGDCYEINFCQEFVAQKAAINPVHLFQKLATASPAPFAALYKLHQHYLISASPERFLTRQNGRLIAQPMKGTARRNTTNAVADEQLKEDLYTSPKERSENVMIVDLVRNDLSQVCQQASVGVDELFGIYSFPQVHQMVSTVSGLQRPGVLFTEILKANFPMGSMTGAPKLRVMQLIDQYEATARGLFSGSVGYIRPNGDFDFNVIIRSVLYNAATGYVSCPVGSGITFYSDAAKEWEECLLKVATIRKVLGGMTNG